jgi:hypothetical protein
MAHGILIAKLWPRISADARRHVCCRDRRDVGTGCGWSSDHDSLSTLRRT